MKLTKEGVWEAAFGAAFANEYMLAEQDGKDMTLPSVTTWCEMNARRVADTAVVHAKAAYPSMVEERQ